MIEWRWVDGIGRPMTNWKSGIPPPALDVRDGKVAMRVEIRIADYSSVNELDRLEKEVWHD